MSGDTVATAMFAHGVRIFGRSLKYHRPRGLYSLDGECANTTMTVDGVANVRTETTPLKAGMQVHAQNVVGSAEFDLMGFLDKAKGFMGGHGLKVEITRIERQDPSAARFPVKD